MITKDIKVVSEDFDAYWKKVGYLDDDRVKEIYSLCPKFKKAVDLGGGSGVLAEKLGGDVLIVDWSEEAEKLAKQKGLKFLKKDILEFILEIKEKFDLIILADIVEELWKDESIEVLKNIHKITKENGHLILSTPTHENYINMSTHQVIYTKEELLKLLDKFTLETALNYSDRLIGRFIKR